MVAAAAAADENRATASRYRRQRARSGTTVEEAAALGEVQALGRPGTSERSERSGRLEGPVRSERAAVPDQMIGERSETTAWVAEVAVAAENDGAKSVGFHKDNRRCNLAFGFTGATSLF